MKKLILLAMSAIMAAGASAQIVTSRTMVKSKKHTPITWYGRIGLSLNNAAGGNDVFGDYNSENVTYTAKIKPAAGMSLDFGFMRPISTQGVYWGMELGIGTRGGAYSTEYKYYSPYREEYTRDDKENSSLLTWNVKYSPFTLGYQYTLNDDIKLDAHIGAFVSYDFAGKAKTKFEYLNGDTDEDDISLSDLKDSHYEFQAFDAGMQLGIGVWWKRFNFDLTWQKGFVTAASTYDDEGEGDKELNITSSNFMIRVGYAF